MSVNNIAVRRPSGLTRSFTIIEVRKSGQREDSTGSTGSPAEDSRPAE